MSDIPSASQKIQIEATQYRAPMSESLAQTMGGSINYALDGVDSNSTSISFLNSSLASLTSLALQYVSKQDLTTYSSGGGSVNIVSNTSEECSLVVIENSALITAVYLVGNPTVGFTAANSPAGQAATVFVPPGYQLDAQVLFGSLPTFKYSWFKFKVNAL